jgi:hypothetical protein
VRADSASRQGQRQGAWSNLHLSAQAGDSTPTIGVGGTWLGSLTDAAAQLNQFYGAVGASYSRLAQVKARYDPGRLFRFPQAIG